MRYPRSLCKHETIEDLILPYAVYEDEVVLLSSCLTMLYQLQSQSIEFDKKVKNTGEKMVMVCSRITNQNLIGETEKKHESTQSGWPFRHLRRISLEHNS
jgi:hypothetical protein